MMGEAEQVIAEPDVEEEEVDGLHPPNLMQQNPALITNILSSVTWFLSANGWYIFGFLLLAYIAWTRFEHRIKRWQRKREEDQEASVYAKNPDLLLARHQAIDEARQRMQDQYNKAAIINLEKQKEREEKMREDKIAEWERMQSGKGHKLKQQVKSGASVSASSSSSGAKGKAATKAKMRPEYNPLTGDTGGASSSCRWRPSDRGSSGGG